MNEFFSDDFYDSQMPLGWSEKDWFAYLKKSNAEIAKFASLYSINRSRGLSLEDIAQMAGWAFPDGEGDSPEEDDDSEFSDEPWTLLNHPLYIITRGLLKCLQEHLGRVIEETQIAPMHVWEMSKVITQISMFISSLMLNNFIAQVAQIPTPGSEQGRERMRRINYIIFDLRQLCLNLAERSAIEKK